MSHRNTFRIIEPINADVPALASLALELWPESFEEELAHYNTILGSSGEACFLVKSGNDYSGFIHMTLRRDYVEGTSSSPVAYTDFSQAWSSKTSGGKGRKLGEVQRMLGNGLRHRNTKYNQHSVPSRHRIQ